MALRRLVPAFRHPCSFFKKNKKLYRTGLKSQLTERPVTEYTRSMSAGNRSMFPVGCWWAAAQEIS